MIQRTRGLPCRNMLWVVVLILTMLAAVASPAQAQGGLSPEQQELILRCREMGKQAYEMSQHLRDEEALELAQQALDLLTAEFGPMHPEVGYAHFPLGLISISTGDYNGAFAHMEQALAISEHNFEPPHPFLATCLSSLGMLHVMYRDLDTGISYLLAGLDQSKLLLPADDSDLWFQYTQTSHALMQAERYAEAYSLLEDLLGLQEKALPPQHTALAHTLNGMGSCLAQEEQHEQALALFTRAMDIFAASEPGERNMALCLDNMGRSRFFLGDLTEAQALHEQALAILETRDRGRGDLAVCLLNLGDAVAAQGLHEQALVHFERALALHKDNPGMFQDFELYRMYAAMTESYAAVGDSEKAREMQRHAEYLQ